MSVNSFIPNVWSETLLTELDREYIGVRNCNRDYEGEIKDKGNTVRIGGLGAISVFDYTKNSDMTAPETLTDTSMSLLINQAKAFNFQIDDVDKTQAQPNLMKAAMRQAAAALADVADQYVYGLYSKASSDNIMTIDNLTSDGIVDMVVGVRKQLLARGVNSNIATSLEVSPEVAALLLKAKILTGTDNSDTLENGLLGRMVGFDIYVSPNIVIDESGRHKCFARTKRAISFAEQLNEVEAYRPENRFADAVKGLHLYGAKVVYSDEFMVIDCSIATNAA